jgi:glyoxylase-like metal-dependent hydrolase (beta-lactamase superfamily II)
MLVEDFAMTENIPYICTTCGVQQAPSAAPPSVCPICADERQYVRATGQAWTTPEALRAAHRIDWRELEPGLFGLGATPQIAIGQRALLVAQPGGGVLWDGTPLVSGEGVDRLRAAGGVRAMAVSHPHFFSAIVEWSEALGGVDIHLHEDLRRYVTRPSARIRFWAGERLDLGEGVTLVRCGGHYSGSTALHWAGGAEGRGVLLASDTIMVVPDTRWVSFMRSYPNLIPLSGPSVERLGRMLEPFDYDVIYGAFFDRNVTKGAKQALQRSVKRYHAAVTGDGSRELQ